MYVRTPLSAYKYRMYKYFIALASSHSHIYLHVLVSRWFSSLDGLSQVCREIWM